MDNKIPVVAKTYTLKARYSMKDILDNLDSFKQLDDLYSPINTPMPKYISGPDAAHYYVGDEIEYFTDLEPSVRKIKRGVINWVGNVMVEVTFEGKPTTVSATHLKRNITHERLLQNKKVVDSISSEEETP